MYVFNAPSHKRNPSPSRNLVKKCLLVRRYLPLRRLHFNRQKPSILENAENVGNAGGVAGDVRVPAPDKDSGSVVLPAEDSAIAKVVEDLLLDLLFEDGSGD